MERGINVKEVTVKTDIPNNRLYVTIRGRLSKKGLDELYTDVRFGVADLRHGFSLISDFSNCSVMVLTGIKTFKNLMAFLAANNVDQVVRIVRKRSVVLSQLLNFTSRLQGYTAIHVATLQEAENILKNTGRRNGVRFNLKQQPIKYWFNDVEGDALIHDISVSGCSVVSASTKASVGDTIQIEIEFEEKDGFLGELKTTANIVWKKDDTFGAKFKDLDSDYATKLLKRFVNEFQCEIVQT